MHAYDRKIDMSVPSGRGGTKTQWWGTCSCGWIGERHESDEAQQATEDYRRHIEEALGPAAYISAEVSCFNCGSRHEQSILLGTHVSQNTCARCNRGNLRPDNAVSRDADSWRIRWS
jgi:hypothetical protein